MVAAATALQEPWHEFSESQGQSVLTVALPGISSLDGVELDISASEVRLRLPSMSSASLIPLPTSLEKGSPVAKFSKKRGQLTLTWPAPVLSDGGLQDKAKAALALQPAVNPSAEAPQPAPAASAYGSIWNANSWHWEEKNCFDLAQAVVVDVVQRCEQEDLKYRLELQGSSIQLKEVKVQGEATLLLRKGRRTLCYELTLNFLWEGCDEFGKTLGVRGRGAAKGFSQEDADEAPKVTVEVSSASGRAPEQRAVAHWMVRTGALRLAERLRAGKLSEAILAAEVARTDPKGDRLRREEEQAKAEAARRSTGEAQAQIAAEQRQRESAERTVAADAVQGSVWNVNAWHWEEKSMSSWSRSWLEQKIKALSPWPLLDGLADAELRQVQVTGDSSVSVRKGRSIVLFQLAVDCQWQVTSYVMGVGEAHGWLRIPELNSEDGADSALSIEVARDESQGRLGGAFKKDCERKVRQVLTDFVEVLANQLTPQATPNPL